MTPAARVQTAIELLDDIFAGAPAEKALTAWARRSRFAGSKDRAAVRDHVFDGLRRRRSALPEGADETGRVLMMGLLHQDGVDLEAIFADLPYGPAQLIEEERSALAQPVEARVDLPDWIVPRMQNALKGGFKENAEALRHRAPVFLRANLRKATRDEAMDALARDGIECEVSPIADTALIVKDGARRVAQSTAYREGLVEVQDASSQAALAGLPLRDGMRVLDYCAGGGGKTLGIGGRVNGTFVAHDANPGRLRDLPERAKRAGLGVEIRTGAQLKNELGFDLVFCDVPCSGSGTWRRTPDAKWRFKPENLQELCEIQAEILDSVLPYLNPNGSLIYATCSLLCEENEDQIARFLKDHPEFQCGHEQRWSMADGCDGFFIAHLTRR